MPGIYDLPAFYPDELWCSALARYHRRSGNPRFYETLLQLRIGQEVPNDRYCDNSPFVSGLMLRYYEARNDEAGFFDALENRTIEPFVLRYSSADTKKAILRNRENRISSSRIHPCRMDTPTTKGYYGLLAFCPQCMREDIETFGEPYWHRTHQIPMSPVCPKHKCRLIFETRKNRTEQLLPSDTLKTISHTPDDEAVSSWGIKYAQYVKATLEAPFSMLEEPVRDAIFHELIKNGYYRLVSYGEKGICNGEKLYRLLETEMDTKMLTAIAGPYGRGVRIRRLLSGPGNNRTEFYIAVAACLNIPPEELFAPNPGYAVDFTRNEIRQMASSGYLWDRDEVLRRARVTPERLYSLLKDPKLKKFWGTPEEYTTENTTHLSVRVSFQEKEEILRRVEELKTADVSEYVRYCIRKEMENSGK